MKEGEDCVQDREWTHHSLRTNKKKKNEEIVIVTLCQYYVHATWCHCRGI